MGGASRITTSIGNSAGTLGWPLVALHRDHPVGALGEQRAREPAGAGADLDERVHALGDHGHAERVGQLDRGARTVEVLKQGQYQPMPVEEQVASIYAGTQGFLDSVGVKDVVRYEAAMLSYLRSDHADVLGKIRDTKALDDDTAKALKEALATFGKQFA